MLVGGPSNGLHSGIVVAELDDRRCGVEVPDVKLVVVAATGNLSVIWGPFQATHLTGHMGSISQQMFTRVAPLVWDGLSHTCIL